MSNRSLGLENGRNHIRTTATNARYPGLTITDDILQQWDAENAFEPSIDLIRVRPHTDTQGISTGYRFAKELATDLDSDSQVASYERGRTRRRRHRFCWELWNTDQTFTYVVGSADTDELTTKIRSRFPDATTAQFTPPIPSRSSSSTPMLRPGQHLAGALIGLKRECKYPLAHHESRGAKITDEDDPHRSIYGAMHSDHRDESAVLQVVFEQVPESWFDRRTSDSPLTWTPYILRSNPDEIAQKDIDAQSGQSAFRVTIRVFALADTRERSTKRVQAMTGMFTDLNNPATNQKLVATQGLLRGYELQRAFGAGLRRTIPRQGRIDRYLKGPDSVLTDRELGMLVRFSGDLGVGQVDSSTIKDAGSVPADTADPEEFLE